MSLRYLLLTLAFLEAFSAWAGSLPEELVRALKQREQFFINRTVVFRLQTDKRINLTPPRQTYSETLLSITRRPTSLHIKSRPAQGETLRSGSVSIAINLEQMQWSAEFHLIDGAVVEVEPDFYVNRDGQSPVLSGTIAHVNRASVNEYGIPSRNDLCLATTWIAGIFTAGLNVTKIPDVRWEKVENHPDRWVLVGKTKNYRLIAMNPQIPWRQMPVPEVQLRVELRKPDTLPLLVSEKPLGDWGGGYSVFRTVSHRKVGALAVPSKIEFQRQSRAGMEKSIYTLLQVVNANEVDKLDLPIGTLMVDDRLGTTVNYRWQGRLPSEEELKKLAYQQGNLIPPDMPRRRFSLLLFVPAIIFFALAAYLYFRNRRR